MGIETIIGAGLSMAGSAMQSDAAGDAAELQSQGTREANAIQERQYKQVREDLTPYRDLGSASTNKLMQLLGLAAPYQGQRRSLGDIRAQLMQQNPFQQAASGYAPGAYRGGSASPEVDDGIYGWHNQQPQAPQGQSFEQYNSEMDRLAQQQYGEEEAAYKAWQAEQAGAAQGADYGSLLRNFTGADLENEPGYAFGLSEGYKGLDRSLARGGMMFSGSALKAAQRFGNDYASTKFGDAFNRDSANKTRTYNFLTGGISTGQNAAAQTGNAGSNMAQQVGANTTAMANAAGAARIAQGNALSGGITGGMDRYQQNQLLKTITGGNTGWGGTQTGYRYTVPTYENPEY